MRLCASGSDRDAPIVITNGGGCGGERAADSTERSCRIRAADTTERSCCLRPRRYDGRTRRDAVPRTVPVTKRVPRPVLVLLLALAMFLVQAGFHGYTAALPLALADAGVPDASIGLIVGTAAARPDPGGHRRWPARGPLRRDPAVRGGWHRLHPGLGDPAPAGRRSRRVAAAVRGRPRCSRASGSPSRCRRPSRWCRESSRRRGSDPAWPFVGAAQNLTLVVMPPALDRRSSTPAPSTGWPSRPSSCVDRRPRSSPRACRSGASSTTAVADARRFGITFRREWAVPLAITCTYVAHWGAVTAYLPDPGQPRPARTSGSTSPPTAIAIFLMRLPTRLAGGPHLVADPDRDRGCRDGRSRSGCCCCRSRRRC